MNRKKIILQAIYRTIPIIFVIIIALIGLNNGIYFKDFPSIGEESYLVQLYYVVSLFLMSGIDFGLPLGESDFYRFLVFTAWILAPIIAATSVIEAVFRSIDPDFFKRKYKDHIIIIGATELSVSRLEYLKGLKEKIIIVDNNGGNINLEYFKKLKNIRILIRDFNSPNIFEKLNIARCKSIWLFTDEDFLNIELSLKVKNTYNDFELKNIEVRCESRILYTDLMIHPEQKIYFKRMGGGKHVNRIQIVSTNKDLANIFYYKFFYQLRDADNLVIYGCNEFTEALVRVLHHNSRFNKKDKRGRGIKREYIFPIKISKIVIIDDNSETIKMKQEKQSLFDDNLSIEYIFSEINNDTTHEIIAKKLPLLDCTKYLILTDDFHLNSKLASAIITTLSYDRPFTSRLLYGNPADKLIYRGAGSDFDNMISINSKDIKGGSFYKNEDKLFFDNLKENGKSEIYMDVYCFDEQHEIKNKLNTFKQIDDDDEFEIPKRHIYIKPKEPTDYIKADINRRIIGTNPGIYNLTPFQKIMKCKETYEKLKDSDFAKNYLIFQEDKLEDRKALEKLFDALINEEKS